MDLENFPENRMARKMLSYVSPDFYESSYVGKWIFEVMGRELDSAEMLIEAVKKQIFPQLADEWGIELHEQKYSLVPEVSDSLAVRRNRVLSRMNLRGSMNPERMRQIIEGITGKVCEIIESPETYTFTIKLIIESDGNINENVLRSTVRRIKPSHLGFFVVTERPLKTNIHIGATMQAAEIFKIGQVI